MVRPKANENDDDFKRVGASGVVALVDDESSGDLEVEADNTIKGSYQPPQIAGINANFGALGLLGDKLRFTS